ncbi:hypothetical protein HZA44_01335 [Candidatus Peregrinibacteria bacterium]|nr:hypothetical protein [Candidatus Peregrinibacteria bacterium]
MSFIKKHMRLLSAFFIVALFLVAGLMWGTSLNTSNLTGALINSRVQRNVESNMSQIKIQPMSKVSEGHFLSSFPNSPWLGNAGYKFRYNGNSEHLIGSIYDRNDGFVKNVCEEISGNISDVYCWWTNEPTMWANGTNTMDGFYKFKFFEDTTGNPVMADVIQGEPTPPQFRLIGASDVFELDVVDLLNP